MSDRSKIEWTEATWNPVTGCAEVSEGCDHCYAKTFAERFRGVVGHPYEQGFDLKLHSDRLGQPLRWKRPRIVFVNSMSDLFHDAVPDEFIARVFATMYESPRHTFQVLTKRPGRMASLVGRPAFVEQVQLTAEAMIDVPQDERCLQLEPWPPRNVWLGTSVESQRWAEVRIPKLLRTPAAVHFLSCEPLLGPINLGFLGKVAVPADLDGALNGLGIDWVIAGGESGFGARPMDPRWARSLRDQCVAARIPFFFKQWGGRTSKAGGRQLDGRTWDEMPCRPVSVSRFAVVRA